MSYRGTTEGDSSEDSRELVDIIGDNIDEVTGSRISRRRPRNKYGAYLVGLLLIGAFVYNVVEAYAARQVKLAKESVPELAHVVEEYQGWRKQNLLALAITALITCAIFLSIIVYRRTRIVRAKRLDSTYWALTALSIFFGFVWLAVRHKARRRDAMERAQRTMVKAIEGDLSKVGKYIAIGSVVILGGLLWYRNRMQR